MKTHTYLLILFILFTNLGSALAQDSATAPASKRYSHPSLVKKIFIGGNYRRTWETPVRLKLFYINREKGGFTVEELGGGMQTKSLHILDKKGTKYTLRTVDKTVDKALAAEGIKSGFVKSVAQDMISAAHPYGALTVTPMAHALEVVAPEPEVFFVPDDPALGEYRKYFANTVCLLEERKPVANKTDKTESSEELREGLKNNAIILDEKKLLQARLLDMLIGDWDRHDSQWLWGHAKGDKKHVYPIPHDHDQAYFNSNGLLIKLVRPFTQKHLVGYRTGNLKLKQLNRKEWGFDGYLMKNLSEADWRNGIRTFQERVTDDVLREAVKQLPREIYQQSGEALFRKLKKRRDKMMVNGMRYYRFISHRPIDPKPYKGQ